MSFDSRLLPLVLANKLGYADGGVLYEAEKPDLLLPILQMSRKAMRLVVSAPQDGRYHTLKQI